MNIVQRQLYHISRNNDANSITSSTLVLWCHEIIQLQFLHTNIFIII